MKPTRVRLSRKKGFKLPLNTVNVARPSKWGNPFVVGRDGTREECVFKYRALLAGYLCLSSKASPKTLRLAHAYVSKNLWRLRGQDLACWCPLDGGPCHGDVLLEAANRQ